ncbi:MAG: hypothetical protein JWN62_4782 [Acidimicrobiales bacterium]|nr:hypothetical protein [Acidimicrobiales bacterium]
MLACEPLIGWRIIADPSALDTAAWPAGSTVVRISPDDVYVIGVAEPTVSDPHAIVTPEHGFNGATLTAAQVADIAMRHIEWQLPSSRPALAQGQIAGVPSKLVLHADGSALLLVATAAHHELVARIGALA